jgi:hypothetical protein
LTPQPIINSHGKRYSIKHWIPSLSQLIQQPNNQRPALLVTYFTAFTPTCFAMQPWLDITPALMLLLAASSALVPAAYATSGDDTAEQSFDTLIQTADTHAEAGRMLAALDLYESAACK